MRTRFILSFHLGYVKLNCQPTSCQTKHASICECFTTILWLASVRWGIHRLIAIDRFQETTCIFSGAHQTPSCTFPCNTQRRDLWRTSEEYSHDIYKRCIITPNSKRRRYNAVKPHSPIDTDGTEQPNMRFASANSRKVTEAKSVLNNCRSKPKSAICFP